MGDETSYKEYAEKLFDVKKLFGKSESKRASGF